MNEPLFVTRSAFLPVPPLPAYLARWFWGLQHYLNINVSSSFFRSMLVTYVLQKVQVYPFTHNKDMMLSLVPWSLLFGSADIFLMSDMNIYLILHQA